MNTPKGDEEMNILVRAPKKLKEILQSTAKDMGMPLNSLMLQILWEWVKSNRAGKGT